uniref:Uncharacterized protein n=1 Tax=Dactylella tenuis TaxID=383872 RepID=A0A4Y5MXK9_9PEZI|nr:hypothetical protein [Dactylella tenuis]QCW06872.1 hypothetical protein [Dactylella tenuis]
MGRRITSMTLSVLFIIIFCYNLIILAVCRFELIMNIGGEPPFWFQFDFTVIGWQVHAPRTTWNIKIFHKKGEGPLASSPLWKLWISSLYRKKLTFSLYY